MNGRRINYRYIVATYSFMYAITISRLYKMKESLLLRFYDR